MWRCRVTCILMLLLTLMCIHIVTSTSILLAILPILWFIAFRPLSRKEMFMFIFASFLIIPQNFAVTSSGGFSFSRPDMFGMPYYEPFMWGFYSLNIKRWVYGRVDVNSSLSRKNIIAFVATGGVFALFSHNSLLLTLASAALVLVLFSWFHDKTDLVAAAYALIMGIVVELFGVHTGQWYYPSPVILGLPLWSVTMWLSVGILLNRFLVPVSAKLLQVLCLER